MTSSFSLHCGLRWKAPTMSYDFSVFDPADAPAAEDEFLAWFEHETDWDDERECHDPAGTTPALRAWYTEMIATFPPMNGPNGVSNDQVDDPHVTDYCIGPTFIYAAFACSVIEAAYAAMRRLAGKHGVGYFDFSSQPNEIWWPDGSGTAMGDAERNAAESVI